MQHHTESTPLPFESLIAAALEELVGDTERLLAAAQEQKPIDKEEIAFWKRQRNAFVKAQTYWLQGVRPVWTGSAYNVPSASRPGAVVHRCYKVGGIWVCSCEAGERGIFHWHTALIGAMERAEELAGLHDDGDDAGDLDLPFVPTEEELERERWLAGLMDVAEWYTLAA
jgi:hypothetical protein